MRQYFVYRSFLLLLLLVLAAVSCYEPVTLVPEEEPDVPWVHCILVPGDTQHLELRYLSRMGDGSYKGIDDAEIHLSAWYGDEYSISLGEFSNLGDGHWQIVCPSLLVAPTGYSLRIVLPRGDTLRSYTSAASLFAREVYPETEIPHPIDFVIHKKVYHRPADLNDNGKYADYSCVRYSIDSPNSVWVFKKGWSSRLESWFVEEALTTDMEEQSDIFNRVGKDFVDSACPEAMSQYPDVVGKPLHYLCLRFPPGCFKGGGAIAVSGDFSGPHYGCIGDALQAVRRRHDAEIFVDTLFGIPHDLEECRWLYDNQVGCVQIKGVSSEYDMFLHSVVENRLLREVSTDIIGIYGNTNIYSNIEGGTGIFGAEVEYTLDWTCGVWEFYDKEK